jgi:glycine betaine/proline transport system ATP-binding protein
LHPATEYVARFTADIDRARVVRVGSLARPLDGSQEGAAWSTGRTIRDLARDLIADSRTVIPLTDANGTIIGGVNRQEALDVLLGDRA